MILLAAIKFISSDRAHLGELAVAGQFPALHIQSAPEIGDAGAQQIPLGKLGRGGVEAGQELAGQHPLSFHHLQGGDPGRGTHTTGRGGQHTDVAGGLEPAQGRHGFGPGRGRFGAHLGFPLGCRLAQPSGFECQQTSSGCQGQRADQDGEEGAGGSSNRRFSMYWSAQAGLNAFSRTRRVLSFCFCCLQ